VIGIITGLQHTLRQKILGLFQGVRAMLLLASGNENLHIGLVSIYLIYGKGIY
jgi:hypothetical protein